MTIDDLIAAMATINLFGLSDLLEGVHKKEEGDFSVRLELQSEGQKVNLDCNTLKELREVLAGYIISCAMADFLKSDKLSEEVLRKTDTAPA